MRDEVVVRKWGSESGLTRAAYAQLGFDERETKREGKTPIVVMLDSGTSREFASIYDLKNSIVELKMSRRRSDE